MRARVPLVLGLLLATAGGCATDARRRPAGARPGGELAPETPRDGKAARNEGGAPTTGLGSGTVDRSALEGLTLEPTVLGQTGETRGEGRRDRRATGEEGEEFFREKVETARAALDAGDDALATDVVERTIALGAPEPWASALRDLRQEIRQGRTESEVMRVDVRGVREFVTFGTDVDLVVRLRNVGTADVVVLPPDDTGKKDVVSGTTLVLTVDRRDRDALASQLVRSWTQVVPLLGKGAEALTIPPESAYEVRVRVPAEDVGPPLAGVRVLEVSGDLRAGRIEAGLPEPLGRLRVRKGRVVVLPPRSEALSADPVGALRKAVAASSPVHLLVATEFVAAEDRPAALAVLAQALVSGVPDLARAAVSAVEGVRLVSVGARLEPLAAPLMEALRTHPDRAQEVMAGLHALTGVSLAPDARLWEDWWRREASGPPSLVPSEEELAARAERGRRR